jgi:hypothetical protein
MWFQFAFVWWQWRLVLHVRLVEAKRHIVRFTIVSQEKTTPRRCIAPERGQASAAGYTRVTFESYPAFVKGFFESRMFSYQCAGTLANGSRCPFIAQGRAIVRHLKSAAQQGSHNWEIKVFFADSSHPQLQLVPINSKEAVLMLIKTC